MEIFYPGGLFGLIPAPVGHGFHRNQRLLLEVISSLVYKLHQIHGYLGATNWIYVHQLVAIENGSPTLYNEWFMIKHYQNG